MSTVNERNVSYTWYVDAGGYCSHLLNVIRLTNINQLDVATVQSLH